MMSRKNLLVIVSFLLLCFTSVSNLAEENTPAPTNIDELKKSVAKIIARYDIPAIGIAMVEQNGPVWIGALGKANIKNNIEADEKTLFRIASTSKMFVALSVLKLVEEGKLTLNAKLADLAPEIAFKNQWEETNPILLVNLLEHTTGWDEQHYPEFAHNDPTPATLKQGLDFHPHSRQSRWVPGTRFSYSNSGPAVAAYIVEKISGQNFEHYIKQQFFDPIGMTSATFFVPDNVENMGATSYANNNIPLKYSHIIMRPSGSINASALDMSRFVQFFLNRGVVNGNRIISEDSLHRMETVKSTSGAKAGQQAGYGLNNYTSFHKQWVYREHNGGFDGAMTEFAYLPEARLGHAFMINSKNPAAFRKISELLRDYETRNLVDKVIENNQTVTDLHREIEGFYYPITPRLQKLAFLFHLMNTQKLSFEGDSLVQRGLLGGKASYFYPVSTSQYKSKANALISLSKVIDPIAGEVIHVASNNAGSGKNTVLKRMYGWAAYSQLIIQISWLLIILSSVAYFMIWFVRKLLGKIPGGATIRVRLWPLLASVSMILMVLLLVTASNDFHKYLSQPTSISLGIMFTTIAFAVFSILAVITVYKERLSPMNQANYWYCAYSSITHFLMMLYMINFGVIGIRFWA
jgi:CubicO group peptidase (beta-lactamase class C family)